MATTIIERPQPTLEDFKAWCLENRRLAEALCLARAAAEVTREKVDAYVRPIFDRYRFRYCGPLVERLKERGGEDLVGKLLPSPAELYLCEDSRVPAYFAACDREHRRQGYDLPAGHCPALTAESLLIAAENALMESANPFFGLRYSPVLDARERYLKLLIEACLAGSNTTSESILRRVMR